MYATAYRKAIIQDLIGSEMKSIREREKELGLPECIICEDFVSCGEHQVTACCGTLGHVYKLVFLAN